MAKVEYKEFSIFMIMQILLSGIVVGSIYSLFAVGMVIVYRGTTVINFSHGELFMLGAFFTFTIVSLHYLNYILGIFLAIIITCIIGGLVFFFIFKNLINAPHINTLLATCGLIFVFQGLARVIWGSGIYFIPPLITHRPIKFMGLVTTSQEIGILIAVSIFYIISAWIFLSTKAGKMMQAASQNLRGAALIGINVLHFHAIMWVVGAGIAALAGILVGPLISVTPTMGGEMLIKAFAAMTLGGFGSILGALIGGVLMGIIENLTAFYISSSIREISAFLIIVIVLLVRPTGIMGVIQK